MKIGANSGVYAISNTETGKVYVGSSLSLSTRWNTHKSQLNNGLHGNPSLQSDWTSYGEEKFKFSVLEDVVGKGLLIAREQHWIDTLKSAEFGYNVRPIATPGGAKQSAEMREALRLVASGVLPIEAAKRAGIRRETLYRHPDYKALKQAKKAQTK